MLKVFGLGNAATKTHGSSASGGKAKSGKGKGKAKAGKKGGDGGKDAIIRSSLSVASAKSQLDKTLPRPLSIPLPKPEDKIHEDTSQEDDIVAFLQQQVMELKLANTKLANSLSVSPPSREFFWVIQDFKWAQKLWVSEPFSFNDRVFQLSFGPTEGGDFGKSKFALRSTHLLAISYLLVLYSGHANRLPFVTPGFILTLVTPMDKTTSTDFKLCAKFRMHHRFNVPYERARPEPMTFSPTALRSRGFVSFASVDTVSSHLDLTTPFRSLKLSVLLKHVP